MNIPISPLTLEVKLRYTSAFLFLGFFVIRLFSIDPVGIESGDETGFFLAWSIYLFITLLLWSLFNRWYFMLPAMVTLIVLTTFTIVIAMVHSHFIEENELLIPMGLFVEGLAFVSFGMYVYRNIKNNNRSARFNLCMIVISCVSPALPFLIFSIVDIIAKTWWGNAWQIW